MPSIRVALPIATALLGASFAGVMAQSPKAAEGTASIVGHVLGQNGEPCRDAEVWATAPDAPDVVLRRARTDGEGMFVLNRLATNALTVHARAPSMTTVSFDTSLLANTATIAVDLRLWEARTLRGRILDSDGKPIAGASLVASKDFASFPYEPAEGTTDAQGRFELRGVPIGECVLRAIAPGFAFNGHVFDDVFDEQVDLVLPRHDGVQLRIEVRGLPEPAARATVVRLQALARGRYSMPPLVELQQLAADGTCTVKGLPETEWVAFFRHPEFRFVPPNSRVSRSKHPELVRVLATPIEPVKMRGRVLADNKPLVAQQILLHRAPSLEPVAPQRGVTDDQGFFEFTARLPVGAAFALQLAGSDWVLDQAMKARAVSLFDTHFLGLYEDTAPPYGEMQLTAVRATPVRGRVVDARGFVGSLTAVELQQGFRDSRTGDTHWATRLRTTTANDGSFAFPGLLAPTFGLRIRALGPGVVGFTEEFQIVAGPAVERNVTTQATGRVEGRLLDPFGEVVPGGCMQLAGEQDITGVMTDHQGRFVFLGLAPGSYRLSAMRESKWLPAAPEPFEVRIGETVQRELVLQ